MGELAGEDVGEDFGVSMRMSRESGLGSHAVFVEDAKSSKVLESWIIITCEGEGVVRVEPSVVGVPTLSRRTFDDFGVREYLSHGVLCGHVGFLWCLRFERACYGVQGKFHFISVVERY